MKYKGKELTEITKGSLDYRRMEILNAFMKAFRDGDEGPWFSIEEIFDQPGNQAVIVRMYGGHGPQENALGPDEFYRVEFSQDEQGEFQFTARPWPVVELAYQPATTPPPAAQAVAQVESVPPQPPTGSPQIATEERRNLGGENAKKGKGGKIADLAEARVMLEAASGGEPRRIIAKNVIAADVLNENGRRYPASVLRAAIDELKNHLHESAGQGRMVQILGEAEHPTDKGTKRANLLETVVKWTKVNFDNGSVSLGGNILETQKGRDLLALMEGGVYPGVSLRGYGETQTFKENGQKIEEVTALTLTGFDLVLEPSFVDAQAVLESRQNHSLEDEMDLLEQLKKLRAEHPELFQGVTDEQLKAMSESQLKKLEGQIREALGIDANANIVESLKAARQAQIELAERKRGEEVDKAIADATKDLPYGNRNAAFVEAIKAAKPQDAAAVKALVEAKRKEYDGLFAGLQLSGMGFTGVSARSTITGAKPVLESETGTPDFARASFLLTESVHRVNMTRPRDWGKAETKNEIFTKHILERFDRLFQRELLVESHILAEATETSGLNLPYSVSRLVVEQAYPSLVASGLFDVGLMNSSAERMYFERFSGETGYSATSTKEVVVADLDAWVKLDYGRITPDSFVLTNSAENVTYVENTDYIVDYAGGRLKAIATITDSQSLKATYNYTAMRDGEMAPIQRGKITLDYILIEAAADRLADQISREAVLFSQSQMGYDVTARLLANLVKQMQIKIDQGLLMLAWSQVHAVTANSSGTWTPGTTQADYAELVRLIGLAKSLVANRYYQPNFILASEENAEILSNWEGFTRAGFPNATLNAAGYAGSVKGLPIFQSTEFPGDIIVVGNSQLVMHRVLQPLLIKGPYQTYHTDGKLIAADQYYTEEFNATESPIAEKGAYCVIGEGGS